MQPFGYLCVLFYNMIVFQEQSRDDRSLSAARSGAASFPRRVRNAMEMHGLDAFMLKEFLLPSSMGHLEVRTAFHAILPAIRDLCSTPVTSQM